MSDIVAKLKQLRKEKGVNQETVAEACGVSRVTIARYENGSRKPEADVLPKLAVFYGVSTDYLMGVEEEPAKKEPAIESDQHAQAISMLDQMSEKDIKEIIQFMEFKLSQRNK